MPTTLAKKKRRVGTKKILPQVSPYRAKVDSKRRIVLRTANYEYYNVYEREDGSLLMTPQIITDVPVSPETLGMIDSSIRNMKKGKVSKRIDLDLFLPKKRKK
ncbi:MAG: hypothetical protein ABI778_02545 [Ignavibacteriota bacterium]